MKFLNLAIRLNAEVVLLARRIKNNLVTSCISPYTPSNLKWYEKDGLLTYIDQLKYKDFIEKTENHFQNCEINFIEVYYFGILKVFSIETLLR